MPRLTIRPAREISGLGESEGPATAELSGRRPLSRWRRATTSYPLPCGGRAVFEMNAFGLKDRLRVAILGRIGPREVGC